MSNISELKSKLNQTSQTKCTAENRQQIYQQLFIQLKQTRINKQWTQRQTAQAAGLSQTTICRAENANSISIWTLTKIIEALGQTLIITPQTQNS